MKKCPLFIGHGDIAPFPTRPFVVALGSIPFTWLNDIHGERHNLGHAVKSQRVLSVAREKKQYKKAECRKGENGNA